MNRIAIALSLLATALLTVTFLGCSPMPDLGELTIEETYQVGESALDDGDNLVATEAFRRITENSPMHELADDALLGLGDAYRQIGDYATAEARYREMLVDYPRSPLLAEASYKLGLCYYEQSPPTSLDQQVTREAIRQLSAFVDQYPESPFVQDATAKIGELRAKLAKKDFDNGMLYVTLGKLEAARIYFEGIADEYGDTVWGGRALLEAARTFVTEGSQAKAEETYLRVIEDYPGTDEAAAASAEAEALGQ